MTLGAAVWLAMSGAFVPILRLYRCGVGLALLLPAMALFYTAATVASAVQFWRGRAGLWKGRFQAASAARKSPVVSMNALAKLAAETIRPNPE